MAETGSCSLLLNSLIIKQILITHTQDFCDNFQLNIRHKSFAALYSLHSIFINIQSHALKHIRQLFL